VISGRLTPAASATSAATTVAAASSTALVPLPEAGNVFGETNRSGFGRFMIARIDLPQVV
jgi:hypothetical protein